MEGRCQCGKIRFTTPTERPLSLFICHCTECRHQTSSAFGTSALFPAFEIEAPMPNALAIYKRSTHKGSVSCYFCTHCGSRLMHRHDYPVEGDEPTVVVKAGCLTGITKDMMRSAVHIWTKSAIVDIPDGVVAYEEQPL